MNQGTGRAVVAMALVAMLAFAIVTCASCGKKKGPDPSGPGGVKMTPADAGKGAAPDAVMGKGDPNAPRPAGKGGRGKGKMGGTGKGGKGGPPPTGN